MLVGGVVLNHLHRKSGKHPILCRLWELAIVILPCFGEVYSVVTAITINLLVVQEVHNTVEDFMGGISSMMTRVPY